MMAALCTWCGTEHEAGAGGFCSDDCRRDFHTACQLWGEGAYGAGQVTVWQLRIFTTRSIVSLMPDSGLRFIIHRHSPALNL